MNNKEHWASLTKQEKIIESNRAKNIHRSNRQEAVNILGGRCVTCGFSDERALQIDHINGGGKKEIQKTTTYSRHKWIINNPDEAKKKYQILCANCNWIKRYENKEVCRFDLKRRYSIMIGERVRQYREKAGLTQNQLASIIGVTGSNISQIEHNDRELRLDKANAICKALKITLTQILE